MQDILIHFFLANGNSVVYTVAYLGKKRFPATSMKKTPRKTHHIFAFKLCKAATSPTNQRPFRGSPMALRHAALCRRKKMASVSQVRWEVAICGWFQHTNPKHQRSGDVFRRQEIWEVGICSQNSKILHLHRTYEICKSLPLFTCGSTVGKELGT